MDQDYKTIIASGIKVFETMGTLDAVVPAYNEEETIAEVVRELKKTPCIGRVIVVSDGSDDQTAAQAREAGADLVLDLAQNAGKTNAMKQGVLAAEGDYVLFLDADLCGLTCEHIHALCRPVLCDEAVSTIGIFKHGRGLTDAAQVISPFLSGQRVVPRDLFFRAIGDDVEGFGAEMAITRQMKKEDVEAETVPLEGVSHRTKEQKRGYWKGVGARTQMYSHIIKTLTKPSTKSKVRKKLKGGKFKRSTLKKRLRRIAKATKNAEALK